jgi:hypothetical protein
MSDGKCWVVRGQIWFGGGLQALADALASAGLNVVRGDYAVAIRDWSHFVLQGVDGRSFDVDADSDTEAEMVEAAERVSSSLRAAKIRHDFEVYCHRAEEAVKRFAYEA